MNEDRDGDLERKEWTVKLDRMIGGEVGEEREKEKEGEGPVLLKVPVSAMLACAKYTHQEVRYGNSLWVLKLNSTKLKQE